MMVTMPLKQSPDHLGESKTQAEKRFLLLEKKLSKNDTLRHRYVAFMHDYEQLNHMSLLQDNDTHIYYYMRKGRFLNKIALLESRLR